MIDVEFIQKEIEKIPGNESILEKLYGLLDSGETLAFVGAGASAGLWPLWNEFLEKFVDHSYDLGKITKDESGYLKKEASQNPLETSQQLRNKIGDKNYYEYLQETFKDKISPQTSGAFTLAHKALLQLPIHNYITLNYDAGLTNARAALYPKSTTSYFFWSQEEARRIRERGYKRLVLHGHGRHDWGDSIILTLNDYRKAYDHRPFVRLLEDIFFSEKLLLIGFGMNDPYIKQLFNNISKDGSKSAFRHIAFIGLDKNEMKVANLHRERVEMIYGAQVLFYPTENHHQALTNWLQMFVEKYSEKPNSHKAEEIKPIPASAQVKAKIKDHYEHEPTNDENFKGRVDVFKIINRWANDPDTRTIAITGIGGQGKTAMIGRWLKYERKNNLKNIPVFYWSFYEDMDIPKFLEQVIKFCLPIVHIQEKDEIEPISFILSVVQHARLLLVLDGLEVLQEDSNSPNHGNIVLSQLNQFIKSWIRIQHKGLMILTSRFHFPQLAHYSGVGFHQLDLVRLSKEDGVTLLNKLHVFGDKHLLDTYVEKLNGHPLALRVLASCVKRACNGDINLCKSEKVIFEDGEGRLYEKLNHLLGFYEEQLKDGQKELMEIISLFKRPVETKSFVALLRKMKSLEKTPLAKADKDKIEKQLNLLINDFLIERTDKGITTHPVIRDYFRNRCDITGSRKEVADFLKAKPGTKRPQTIEEVRDLVEAVQLLCDEGEFNAADNLVVARLAQGGYGFNIFRDLPALSEGLECNLAFVGDKERKQKVEEILGIGKIAFYSTGVSLYNYYLGNLTLSIEWRYRALEIQCQENNKGEQARDLHVISGIEITMGCIKKARKTVSKALKLSLEIRELRHLARENSYRAYYNFLLGNSKESFYDFEIAVYYEFKKEKSFIYKYYDHIANFHLAEILIRFNKYKEFIFLNTNNTQNSINYRRNPDIAYSLVLKGWYKILQKEYFEAEQVLTQAERTLRPSGLLERTCRLDWVWGMLENAKGNYKKGLHHVNNALPICAEKEFRLWLADLFILRGRLFLMQFEKENKKNLDLVERAGDDGNEALKIADDTGYIWAKVDALKLLVFYHKIRSQLPGIDKQKEKELTQSYEKEAALIEKGLFLTEEQIEQVKEQARKEFDEQTVGWEEI